MPVQIEMRDRSIQEGPELYNEYMFVVRCIIYILRTYSNLFSRESRGQSFICESLGFTMIIRYIIM